MHSSNKSTWQGKQGAASFAGHGQGLRPSWVVLSSESHMLKLGFQERWVSLTLKCVQSVAFSIRMNGHHSDYFQPTQGIRQGDPISPYMFVLCVADFSAMLNSSGPLFLSRVIRVGIHAPWIHRGNISCITIWCLSCVKLNLFLRLLCTPRPLCLQ
jgi:hypothetical protein